MQAKSILRHGRRRRPERLQSTAVDRQPPLSWIPLIQIGSQNFAAGSKLHVHLITPIVAASDPTPKARIEDVAQPVPKRLLRDLADGF